MQKTKKSFTYKGTIRATNSRPTASNQGGVTYGASRDAGKTYGTTKERSRSDNVYEDACKPCEVISRGEGSRPGRKAVYR